MKELTIELDRILSSASEGIRLADDVIEQLRSHDRVHLDFAFVQFMTPSFTNALVMSLLHVLSADDFAARVEFDNTSERIEASLQRSQQRFEAGIRLSGQQLV